MEKDIRYNGVTAVPSDYESLDGDLGASVNLINEEEEIRPIIPPKQLFYIPNGNILSTVYDGYKVVYIHKTSSYTHYILIAHKKVSTTYYFTAYWVDGSVIDNAASLPVQLTPQDLHKVSDTEYTGYSMDEMPKVIGIGNTLILYAPDAMHYILWKAADGSIDARYQYLGTHLPELEMRVGLLGHARFYSQEYDGRFTVSYPQINYNTLSQNGMTLKDSAKGSFTDAIIAKVNKFIAEHSVGKGMHCFPFFVRYALRLYDGSLAMMSAPILMNPCTHSGPIVIFDPIQDDSHSTQAKVEILMMASQLTIQACNNYGYTGAEYDTWKDIVKSVDIFISKPLYTYNQDGMIDKVEHNSNDFKSKFVGKVYSYEEVDILGITSKYAVGLGEDDTRDLVKDPFNGNTNVYTNDGDLASIRSMYTEWTYEEIYAMYMGSGARTRPSLTVTLPEHNTDKLREILEGESAFYLLKSIPFDEICASYSEEIVVKTPDDYLQSLLSRETLPDDYQSHDRLIPDTIFGYNNRINLAGIKRELYRHFDPRAMWARCDDDHSFSMQSISGRDRYQISSSLAQMADACEVYVHITDDFGNHVVRSYEGGKYMVRFCSYTSGTTTHTHSSCCWFFYPNPNATKATIVQGTDRYEFNLKPHPLLNGAYALFDYDAERPSMQIDYPYESNVITESPNKIYTSEINNPFAFPLLGINSVGTGKVLGLATATKALSQGQFGAFPLYAFTTEGLWAMEISDSGMYRARQPVTRDVCVSTDSITQLDDSVVFATDRGLMLLQGSVTKCITDDIMLDHADIINTLRGLTATDAVYADSLEGSLDIVPFRNYIGGGRLSYDYTHQRLVVYNPSKRYAYVYSMKSNKWGMMYSTLIDSLNSYPGSICTIGQEEGSGIVVDYSLTDDTVTSIPFVLVSRPIKLDAPDTMKTISSMIQRGKFTKGHVRTLLYGSRDNYNWNLVSTSVDHYLRGYRGTPYKYFRIALIGELGREERIYSATIDFELRLTDKIR